MKTLNVVLVMLVVGLASTAQAGRVGRAAGRGIISPHSFDNIGVRPTGDVANDVTGRVVRTEVLEAPRLTAFGFRDVREGDVFEVKTLVPGKRYEVKSVRTSQMLQFTATEAEINVVPPPAPRGR